ncbi:hypothetical protein [Dactylosporangium sp. NPDC048998]|uniref:hypothetical protein n=1 Tax=Dactylosporangium sp. NPDC048998 TaxID=3363976 RepID=UPI003723F64F
MFERTTTDTRAVLARIPSLALAAKRRQMTLPDLAAALSTPTGNTAEVWHAPAAEPPPTEPPPTAESPPAEPPSTAEPPSAEPPSTAELTESGERGGPPSTAEPPSAAEPPTAGSGTSGTVPPASVSGAPPDLRFDRDTRVMLEQARLVALRERAEHIGTEHLLAALVRTGPPDVVTWLADRGATAEAVDALLARLRGGPGVERLPAELSRADRWNWRRAAARVHGDRRIPRLLTTGALLLAAVVVFVFCVWGP